MLSIGGQGGGLCYTVWTIISTIMWSVPTCDLDRLHTRFGIADLNFYASNANNRQQKALCFPVSCLVICLLSVNTTSCDAVSLCLAEGFQRNLPQIITICAGIVEKFSRSDVKGQGQSKAKCTSGWGTHIDLRPSICLSVIRSLTRIWRWCDISVLSEGISM